MSAARWWLFKCGPEEVDAAVNAACRMMLARVTATPTGYEISTAREFFVIGVSQRRRALELSFHGPWRTEKKGALLRSLLAKQFEPVVPRLRIRLRRRR